MGVRTGDRIDVCTDDCTGNYRTVVEVFVENDCEAS